MGTSLVEALRKISSEEEQCLMDLERSSDPLYVEDSPKGGYRSFSDDEATSSPSTLRAVIAFLSVLVLGLAIGLIAVASKEKHEYCDNVLVGSQPVNSLGESIPQVLASRAQAGRENVMLSGSWWEPMDVIPGRALTKGKLDPTTTALVVIDMQPLFYDEDSPWGVPGGLEKSAMGPLWPRQLELGRKMASFTGRADSTILTRYVVPENASMAQGIMRHYYGMRPGHADTVDEEKVTLRGLEAAGLNTTYMLEVMPELQPLVQSGAQVSTKTTGGAFGPGSALPQLLDAYFKNTGGGNATRTLIVAGVETDYCVISTILGAIDSYYRIIVVTDAIGSSQPNAGQAQLDYTLRRFDHMVDLGTAANIMTFLE